MLQIPILTGTGKARTLVEMSFVPKKGVRKAKTQFLR